MKKVIFTIEGRRFEIELENDFATYIERDLKENDIVMDGNNEVSKLVQAYLILQKENYDAKEQIKTLLNKI